MHAILSTITLALSVGMVTCSPRPQQYSSTTITTSTTAPTAPTASPVRDSYGCLEGSLTTANNQTFVQICNADYPYNDLVQYTLSSYTACLNKCAEYNGCAAAVWNKNNQICFLKDGASGWYYQPVADAALLLNYNFA